MKIYVYENFKDMKNKENCFVIENVDDVRESLAGGIAVTCGQTGYMFPNTVYAVVVEE